MGIRLDLWRGACRRIRGFTRSLTGRVRIAGSVDGEPAGPGCSGCDTFASVPEGHAPFAVFNRTANPVVRAVLSSSFHPLLSRNLALISVTGRRTGRRYTFPVGYRQDGDRVLINVGITRAETA